MSYSPERSDPVILAIADGNRECANAGKRFVYNSMVEYGWDVSYLSTYSLEYSSTAGAYEIIALQDAMITPDFATQTYEGGYRSSFFDISNETGEGIVIGCRQYLNNYRNWDMYCCLVDATVLDQNYWSSRHAYILRNTGECEFTFIPDDNQYQGVGYPDAPGTRCRRGNTAGEIVQDETTTSAYLLAGTHYNRIGGLGEIPDNTPGGIFVASRVYNPADGDDYQELTGVSISDKLVSLTCRPNPSSGMVSFGVELSDVSDIVLVIYDMRGCIIDEVYRGVLSQGSHVLTWEASDAPDVIANGIYYVQISVDDSSTTRRLVLVD
jgi:hypothetical protein